MKTVTVSENIRAPRDAVFAVLCDIDSFAALIPDVQAAEKLSDGPFGVGTRWRETRVMFGKEATEEMEVVAFDPPVGYDVQAESHGSRYMSRWTLAEADGVTTVRMAFSATPLTPAAKFMSLIMGGMMLRAVSKCLTQDLEAIKAALESG